MPVRKPQEDVAELVSRLRQANENLVVASLRAQDLQDEAKASIERQKEFLAMLAHELRNPLAPIAMAVSILEKIAPAHPQLPYIHQVIGRQVGHITRLLEDLLDASRVTSGKINLRKSLVQLSDIVYNAVEISQPLLDKKRQQLIIDVPELPVVIEGDAVRLAQVFSNLLINASKYSSQHQSIALSARLADYAILSVSVKDEGVGIDPDIQPYVFDLFTQAPRTLDRSEGGLGIGLSMVRSLVEMHGGTVSVHSAGLGRGSEFIVLLPVSGDGVASEAGPVAALQPVQPCRILVIEDNVDANETLSFCLVAEGHTVASAFDGPSGLAMAKEGSYDIVVCDIGLPGMNGYQVLRQMRLLALDTEPGYIAMTGYDQQDQSARAGQPGFDHYLVKPVSIAALQAVISTITRPATLA